MRYNRKKHRLLTELQRKEQSNRERKKANLAGLTFEKMESLLSVNRSELEIILSELLKNQEVHLFDINGEKGAIINDELGFLAISNKKYLNKNEDIIINW